MILPVISRYVFVFNMFVMKLNQYPTKLFFQCIYQYTVINQSITIPMTVYFAVLNIMSLNIRGTNKINSDVSSHNVAFNTQYG